MNRPVPIDRLRELATITPNAMLNPESAEELRALAAENLLLRESVVHERAELRLEQDARAHLRVELDQVRMQLGQAVQTLELNAATGPCISGHTDHCACCGRKRGDGRRDRRWVYPIADVSRAVRFSVRIAFCAKCFDELEARAAKHIGKEQREQPGELEEVDRG